MEDMGTNTSRSNSRKEEVLRQTRLGSSVTQLEKIISGLGIGLENLLLIEKMFSISQSLRSVIIVGNEAIEHMFESLQSLFDSITNSDKS
jgi:hypothetical protein